MSEDPRIEALLRKAAKRKRGGGWSTRLAVRSVLTCVVAIVVGVMVSSSALPKLEREVKEAGGHRSPVMRKLVESRSLLPFAPVPGLLLGIAALVLRPLRAPLALAAMLATVACVGLLIATLGAAMAPLYDVPADLQPGITEPAR